MGSVFSTVNWSLCAPKSFDSNCFSRITVFGRGIGDLVGNRRRVTLGCFVDAEVIDLHPEVQVLVAVDS